VFVSLSLLFLLPSLSLSLSFYLSFSARFKQR
jgi:hypothetical protein